MIHNVIGTLHSTLVFERRIRAIANSLATYIKPGLVLDVGCGNGMIGKTLMDARHDISVVGVDTLLRARTFIPVLEYDGKALPFNDKTFSTILLIDVLHHTQDPELVLRECSRVCEDIVMVKDHFSEGMFDFHLLKILDWVGNRPYKVQLPYNFFSRQQWQRMLQAVRLREIDRTEKVPGMYPAFFQKILGERIQFISALSKNETT